MPFISACLVLFMLSNTLLGAQSNAALPPRSGEANILNFGAKPGTPDYADEAISKAIGSGASVIYFPAGLYHLRKPINVTDRVSGSLVLDGAGTGDRGGIGTTIMGDTGSAIIDATGSQFVTVQNLTLTAGSADPSTIGILLARSKRGPYAQFDRIKNVSIYLPPASAVKTAAGVCGSIGVYNFGAELFRSENLYIRAYTPLVLTNENFCHVKSLYTAVMDGQTSMSVAELASNTLWAFGGPAMILLNTINVRADSLYLNSQSTGSSPYAIEARGNNTLTSLNVSIENFPQVMTYSGVQESLSLSATTTSTQHSSYLVADGTQHACATLRGAEIRVVSTNASEASRHFLLDYKGSNVCGVEKSVISLGEFEGINMPLGVFSATVYSEAADPKIQVAQSPGFANYVLIPRRSPIKVSGDLVAESVVLQGVCSLKAGPGNPNDAVAGKPCDMYLSTSGGAGTTLFIKETGQGTKTGWKAK